MLGEQIPHSSRRLKANAFKDSLVIWRRGFLPTPFTTSAISLSPAKGLEEKPFSILRFALQTPSIQGILLQDRQSLKALA